VKTPDKNPYTFEMPRKIFGEWRLRDLSHDALIVYLYICLRIYRRVEHEATLSDIHIWEATHVAIDHMPDIRDELTDMHLLRIRNVRGKVNLYRHFGVGLSTPLPVNDPPTGLPCSSTA
jgi:hypothetical protein